MKPGRLKQSLPLYLIPIMIGLSGILFAQQFTDPLPRALVVLISVGAPLFAVGHAMGRLHATRKRRFILGFSAVLLTMGGMVTLLDIATSLELKGVLASWVEVPVAVWEATRWTSMIGLLLGLFILLYTVVLREEEIGEIARRFSSLAEHMSEGFALAAPDGTVKMVNQSFLRMTGLQAGEILNERDGKIARQLKLQPLFAQMEGRPRGASTEYTLAWPREGGTQYFWVSVTPIFDGVGDFAGTLATFRDITELHELNSRLEEYTKGLQELVEDRTRKLRYSQERLRDLLLNMNEGFLTITAAHTISFANERICQLLQRSVDSVIGMSLYDAIDPGEHNRLRELLRIAHSQRTERLQQELTLLRDDGGHVPVMVAVAPIDTEGEKGARFSMVLTDISALKTLQRQLLERANALEAANEELRMLGRAKDGFLTTVSHELRTPLSTIRGYVEMFTSGSLGDLESPQRNALDVMERNLQRLGFLIEEMIEFGRMQVRGIELSWTVFDVAQLIAECAHSTEPHLRDRQLILTQNVPEGLPAAWGDRKRISQALTILLSNAVKFSHKGGSIEVNVVQQEGNTLRISVVDHGIGISKSNQKRVFEKFYQVDGSLSRRYEGAGIGLSIAKSILDAHGGTIELESEPGQGSTFALVLPKVLFPASLSDETKRHLDELHVVLVDDEPEERAVLASVLDTVGVHVAPASNSFEALRMAAEQGPDAVLVSDSLTDLTWSIMVSRLHENPATSTIPAIVMTNESPGEESANHLTACEARMLPRPFSVDRLVRALLHVAYGEMLVDAPQSLELIGAPKRRAVALVVDTDPDHLDWLEAALTRRKIPCRCVTEWAQAEEMMRSGEVSVIAVDIDGTGSPSDRIATARAHLTPSSAPIFALTGLPNVPEHIEGAEAVLRKPFKIETFVEAIGPYIAADNGRGPARTEWKDQATMADARPENHEKENR